MVEKHTALVRSESVITAKLEAEDDQEPPLTCPGCGMGLEIEGGVLTEWKPVEVNEEAVEAELKGVRGEIATIEMEINERRQLIQQMTTSFKQEAHKRATLQTELDAINGEITVHKRDARFADKEASEGVDDGERSKLENQLETAKERLDMWNKWQKATKAHEAVVENDNIIKLLKPEGARNEHMQKNMDSVRKHLRQYQQ